MTDFARSVVLLLMLLNPFLIIIYLIDVVQKVDAPRFGHLLIRACLIAYAIFICFTILGDAIFSDIVQVEFASFQIFGGLVFLLIGLQFVFHGPRAIEILRGESEYLSGAIAIPVLVGPGTIGASVIIGKSHEPMIACAAVLAAVVSAFVIIMLLKLAHDYVLPRRERLIERYIEIAGRISALYVGTVSVNMIMQGVRTWAENF